MGDTALQIVIHRDDIETVMRILQMLDTRERYVVTNRLGLYGLKPKTFVAIAKEICRTTSRASQIYKKAIGKMRYYFDVVTE